MGAAINSQRWRSNMLCCHLCVRPCIHDTGTKSNRDHFVSVIVLFVIDVYMHETGTKIIQTGLMLDRLLDRVD